MRKIGHRGACGHAPENTRASFIKALTLGVDGVEFDIQLSKDNEPMVIHDDTINRTTNGRGKVRDYSYWELQQFDAGDGERIPHLRDVFTLVDKRCDLLIELKCDAVVAVDKVIREQVALGWQYEKLWVLSFDHALLKQMHAVNEHIQLCASYENSPTRFPAVARAIAPNHSVLDAALITSAHAKNLSIMTWTVNKPEHINRVKMLGVDSIISDFPERIS